MAAVCIYKPTSFLKFPNPKKPENQKGFGNSLGNKDWSDLKSFDSQG